MKAKLRLLWKGKLTYTANHHRYIIEWGPPIIWRPRYASYNFPNTGKAYQFGLGWWLMTVGQRESCRRCYDLPNQHPTADLVRFEWAATARPSGWWYYRPKATLAGPSLYLRDHVFEG